MLLVRTNEHRAAAAAGMAPGVYYVDDRLYITG
jgi:hypothetical protein